MNEDSGKNLKLTEFDYLLADPQLQMVKAALPYMGIPQQRIFSMLIKLRELNRTRSLFSDGELSAMGLSSGTTQSTSPFEMFQAIKAYASPKDREMIEMLENFQIMMQAMQSPT